MPDNTEVLAPVTDDDLRRGGLPDNMKMAPGLAIYFVDSLYQRCKAVALRMSEARGMVGPHLINNPGACMAIISRSITWNLDPFAVAQATYEVNGKIGYEGKLCQAILENCGAIEGRVEFEFFGEWDKLRGKFRMVDAGQNKGKKPEQTWTDADEEGLGVIVRAQVKGETTPREEEFYLAEMWPRNSTLWILRPKQQMRYAAVRAFGNIAVPGIIMGIPFDVDPSGMGGDAAVDITPPRPQRGEFERAPERDVQELGDWTAKVNFANGLDEIAQLRKDGLAALPQAVHARFEETCDGRARQISSQIPGGQDDDQAGRQEEAPPPPDEKEVHPADQETPFQRGTRLLGVITVAADVRDLFESISAELTTKKDRDLWKGTAEARFKELGGQGPMLVDAKKRK